MKTPDLDRLFDESANRIKNGTGALSGAYATSPLAADHLLLKRSWDYFRHRINAIEEQWQKIVEAKEAEKKALEKELSLNREQTHDLEIQNTAFRSFEYEYGRSKAEDYIHFQKQTENLKFQWEQEREVLMKTQSELELKILKLEADSDRSQDDFLKKQARWKDALDAARTEAGQLVERHRERQNEWLAESAQKDADNKDLILKIDLLRAEVENRDQMIKHMKEEIFAQERQKTDLASQLALAMGKIRELEGEMSVLSERYGILMKEKDAIREEWSREQAEWRELWERQREMFDREKRGKSDRDEDVDSK